MSQTVKLEGLSISVSAEDIRFYFAGLEIPQGGITIIGGKRGVAYLSFNTIEDARRAIRLSGYPIRDSIVRVYPSCTEEMKRSLMKCQAPYYGRNGVHEGRNSDRRGSASSRSPVYLRITVTAGVTTTTSVRRYFSGLHIADILSIKDDHALRNGALVKFYSSTDATEGMRRYRNSTDVNVVWSSEREWVEYGGKVYYDEDNHSFSSRHERISHHSRSPERHYHSSFRSSRSPRWRSRSPQRYSRSRHEHTRSPRWDSRSPLSGSRSPRLHSRSPHMKSKFPRRLLADENDPIFDGDFHVHVTNLRYATKKEDLRKWFFDLVSNDHIKFLYDEKGQRTRECFVMFKNEEDQRRVLRLDKVTFDGRLLFINAVSKSNMRNLLTGRKALFSHHHMKGKCLYLRNFPADVTKTDIQKFFTGFTLNEEDISLLCDRQGVGLGEVMVSFSSEEELAKAEKLHRKKFKDKEIPLRRIPEDKLQSFLSANSVSLIPEDPYDCVTQEDDQLDEDGDQENNTPDEGDQDDHLPEEDSGFHQTDNTHEYVTQADDAIDDPDDHVDEGTDDPAVHVDEGTDDPAVHVDEGTDDPAVHVNEGTDDPAVHVNEGTDDPAVQVDEGTEDPAVHLDKGTDDPAVHADDGMDDPAVHADDRIDDPAVHADDRMDDPAVHADDGTDDSAVHVDDALDDPAVHVDDAPSTKCISDENSAHVNNDTAIVEGATSNEDGLGQ